MQLPSFLRRLISKRAAPNTWVPMIGATSHINERNLLEANKEWVFIAVDKLATSMAGIRFKVMRYARSGDDQEVFDGPLVDFLENPGANFTGKDFIYLNTVYKELTGNAFWELITKHTVQPLVPTQIAPVVKKGEVLAYKYAEDGALRIIQPKNILHDRYIDPARPWWGKGKLQRIARWVDTSSYVTEFLSRFFVNGATFGGFIETEEETEERINLIKAGLMNDHVGVEKAHKIGVLPKGSKFSKVTSTMAEMEMGETDDRYRDKILTAFGVPKTLVGLTTEVNRASAEASEYIYSRYTIKPIADDFVEFLNTNVAPLFDDTGAFYFAYDDFVPVNQEIEIEKQKIALAGQQYMTVNEARASSGLPPVKGGDVVYGDPYLLPLGTPAPAPEPAADDADDDEPVKAIPMRARKALSRERAIDLIVSKATEVITAHHDPDEESHKKFVGRVDDYQALIAGQVRDFNNRQERDVSLRLKQIAKAVQKGDLFDMDGQVSLLIDVVTPLLKTLMLEQAAAEFLDQAFPGTFDASLPRISTLVQSAARRLAKSYNRTTARLLADTLNEGIRNGEDLTQLTDRVREVYDFSNTTRARAVAHTEAFYIANEGSREAYRQSGVVQTMRWYTAEDERVCEFCGPQHGMTVGVNEVFYPKGHELQGRDGGTLPLTYRAIDVPPLHTNCRCFIRPERIDIG